MRTEAATMMGEADTVLVVEGNHDIRDILRDHQGTRRRYVVLAHTSADASCVLRMVQIDAVVVDLALPAMNGWGFLEAHRRGARATVPVILVTRTRDIVGIGTDGVVAMVDQPFSSRDLVAIVDDICAQRRSVHRRDAPHA